MKRKFGFIFIFSALLSCNAKSPAKVETTKTDTVFVEKTVYVEQDLYPSPFSCGDSISQTDMNMCAGKELLYFDSIMNLTYDSLLLSLEPKPDEQEGQKKYLNGLKNQLIISQKKWKEYMLSNAEYVSKQYEGGTIRPMVVAMQKTSDTKTRINALNSLKGNF